ncbi:MAG: hypothetical protein ACHQUC_07305, partial [Chlamydiales bacterium]
MKKSAHPILTDTKDQTIAQDPELRKLIFAGMRALEQSEQEFQMSLQALQSGVKVYLAKLWQTFTQAKSKLKLLKPLPNSIHLDVMGILELYFHPSRRFRSLHPQLYDMMELIEDMITEIQTNQIAIGSKVLDKLHLSIIELSCALATAYMQEKKPSPGAAKKDASESDESSSMSEEKEMDDSSDKKEEEPYLKSMPHNEDLGLALTFFCEAGLDHIDALSPETRQEYALALPPKKRSLLSTLVNMDLAYRRV